MQFHTLLLFCVFTLCSTGATASSVTKYTELSISLPATSDSKQNVVVKVPTQGEHAVADPATLYSHIKDIWDTVVEEHQAGKVHVGGLTIDDV